MKPHKHAEVIKAWADGAEVQYLDGINSWIDAANPQWDDYTQYRIKPEPKPNLVVNAMMKFKENGIPAPQALQYEVEVVYEVRKTFVVDARDSDRAKWEVKFKIFSEGHPMVTGSLQFLKVEAV